MATSTTVANGPVTAAATGGGTWGSITGTLSDQPDLNTALGLKAPLASPTFTGTAAHATGTFSGAVTISNNTASTTASTGALIVTGGAGIGGAVNIGSTLTVYSANLLFNTTGNVGRDTGVSGSLTDCPVNGFFNFLYTKTGFSFAANSASVGLTLGVDSTTSVSIKTGSTALFSVTSTQTYFLKEMHLGSGENTIVFFGPSTGFDSNNAANVNLYSFDTSGRDNWMFTVRIYLGMRRTDSGAEFGQIAKSLMFSRESGTVTARGTVVSLHPDDYVTMAPTGVTGAVSGNNLQVNFAGETGKRIEGNYWGTITMHST